MTRPMALIILLISLTACTSQEVYSNHAYISNICNQPLTVKIHNGTNFRSKVIDSEPLQNNSLIVASYKSFGESITKQVSDDYELILETPNTSKKIKGADFRNYLITAKKTTSGHVRSWIIENNSICP